VRTKNHDEDYGFNNPTKTSNVNNKKTGSTDSPAHIRHYRQSTTKKTRQQEAMFLLIKFAISCHLIATQLKCLSVIRTWSKPNDVRMGMIIIKTLVTWKPHSGLKGHLTMFTCFRCRARSGQDVFLDA
jgi:hypothetical protein